MKFLSFIPLERTEKPAVLTSGYTDSCPFLVVVIFITLHWCLWFIKVLVWVYSNALAPTIWARCTNEIIELYVLAI